jgi:hypothetical protein
MRKKPAKAQSWDEIGKTIGSKIERESKDDNYRENCCRGHSGSGCGGAYGLGFLGALAYFVTTANGFWAIIVGVLKAIVWPAFLAYYALKFLGA